MECALRYAIDNLRKSATCCICLGFFNRPVRLSCNHTYCEDCISPVLNAKKICPVCSSDIRRRYITCEVDCQSAIDKVSEFIALMEAAHPTLFKSACKAGNKRPHDTDPLESIIGSTDFPTEATTATTSTLHSTETPAFTVGDLVQVQMRTTAGVNKLGGVGRVCEVTPGIGEGADATTRYSVKYVLGNVERNLEACFVSQYTELDPSARRQRPPSDAPPSSSSSSSSFSSATAAKSDQSRSAKRRRTNDDEENANNEYYFPSEYKAKEKDSVSETKGTFKKPASRTMVLLSTSLDPHLQSKLSEFAERCGGGSTNRGGEETVTITVANSFTEEVTHLVVSVDKHRVLKQRTMKYLQAVITGKWIVSMQWVLDSLRHQAVQAEEPYEVADNAKASVPGAPRRARLAMQDRSKNKAAGDRHAGIFSRFVVLLYGNFPQPGPAKSDISFLLTRGGATLCNSAQELCALLQSPDSPHVPIIVVASEESLTQFKQSADPEVVLLHRQPRLTVQLFTWVLDSVVNFAVPT